MSKEWLGKQKFIGSLHAVIVLRREYPELPFGAVRSGDEILSTIPDDRITFQQVWYTTPKRIYGLLHYEVPSQIFFMGYECGRCHQIFLVADSVHDEPGLCAALRHACTESQPELSLRTRVLHCVQDIGRPGGLGSVGCELWADRIMALFEEPHQ